MDKKSQRKPRDAKFNNGWMSVIPTKALMQLKLTVRIIMNERLSCNLWRLTIPIEELPELKILGVHLGIYKQVAIFVFLSAFYLSYKSLCLPWVFRVFVDCFWVFVAPTSVCVFVDCLWAFLFISLVFHYVSNGLLESMRVCKLFLYHFESASKYFR